MALDEKEKDVFFNQKKTPKHEVSLSREQLDAMIHMTGVKSPYNRRRSIYYYSFRNYYWAGQKIDFLEDLVNKEIMIFRDKDNGDKVDRVYYLTKKGYEVLCHSFGHIKTGSDLVYEK